MENGIEMKLSTQLDSQYVDIYNQYGVRLMKGSYEALLKPPGLKSYVTNQSRLKHGTLYTVPPSSTRTKDRNVSLTVLLEASSYDDYLSKFEAFLNFLAGGIVCMKVPRLKRVFKLVYTDCSRFNFFKYKDATFTLEFVEPNTKDRITLT